MCHSVAMDDDEPHFESDSIPYQDTNDEVSEEESWLSGQFWYLISGILFGVMANLLSRMWTTIQGGGAAGAASGLGVTTTSSAKYFSHDNKMVFVIRTDLQMGKGKVAAQCAHAAIMCYKRAAKETPQLLKQWELFGQTKVTVKGENLQVLDELESKAKSMGMVTAIVRDAGRTQVETGTPTVLGIGPAPTTAINEVTGHLKLY